MESELQLATPENQTDTMSNFLVLQDRDYALSVLSSFLSATQLILQIADEYESEIVCPYQQTVVKHLGAEYKPTPIKSLTIPTTFNLKHVVKKIDNFIEKTQKSTLDHYETMCSLASSKNFEGYFNPNLGNAFAEISGNDIILNESRLKNYLDFIESIDTMSAEDIDIDPIGLAQKLLVKYELSVI